MLAKSSRSAKTSSQPPSPHGCFADAGVSFRRSRRRQFDFRHRISGFTLIEIVVGLILLASLAVGAILATQVHSRQLAAARKRTAAVRIADDLLQQWADQRIPVNQQGPIPQNANWIWRTQIIAERPARQRTGQIIRLQIVDMSQPPDVVLVATDVFQLSGP